MQRGRNVTFYYEKDSVVEEELIGPNYDNEMQLLWDEVKMLIEIFSGEKLESSTTLIAMLKCLPELSQIFGVDKSDFLI